MRLDHGFVLGFHIETVKVVKHAALGEDVVRVFKRVGALRGRR